MLRKLFAFAMVAAMTSSAAAATILGTAGDGKPSIQFNYLTGAVSVEPDGVPVGLFDILSDTPIFNATPAALPAGGLFTTDNTTEKAWASLGGSAAFTTELNLGLVAIPATIGQTKAAAEAYLMQHLTITYSGGFGTPNVNGDVTVVPVPEPMTLSMLGLASIGGLGFIRRRR